MKRIDAQASEGDQHSLGRQVDACTSNNTADLLIPANSNTDNSDNEFASTHASRSDEEQTTTTDAINEVNAHNSHCRIDDVANDSNDERIADTSRLEESRPVID